MAVKIESSKVIDRPVADVFQFIATDHIRNHPRWDPDIELWPITDGPIGVGTIIGRRSSRSGTPVEGTMEVVEFEPDRVMAMLVHDGPVAIRGRMTFEALNERQTRITNYLEIPGAEATMDTTPLRSALESRDVRLKHLIESEVPRR